MSKIEETPYQLFNSYCIRTPLFSFSNYKKRIKKSAFSDVDFKEILNDSIFREALFLASPELQTQIEKWENGSLKDPRKIERLQIVILKYFTRISTRCTPFGLFASCTAGSFGLETTIQILQNTAFKRHTRFDTTFLSQLLQELLNNNDIKESVLFFPNTSIYKIGNHFRYVEYTIENKKRRYSLEGVNHSIYIEKTLKTALEGKTILELANIVADNDITFEEAKHFINDLIENQILVSELEITVTGKDYFENLLNRIKKIPQANKVYNKLEQLQNYLIKLDTNIGNKIEIYQSVVNLSREIVPELNNKYLFQTDTYTSFKNIILNRNIKEKLKKVFAFFNKMTLPSANSNIEQFKRDFLKRFKQSEIPLNLALDTETGIGFGSKKEDTNELIDDFQFSRNTKRYEKVIWTNIDTIIQEKLIEATYKNKYTILLSEDDFKNEPLSWSDLPDTFSSLIEVYKNHKDEKIFIKGIEGTTATYLLGRFSNGDKKILDHINEITDIEKKIHPNKILAEIVHLPEARTGNIIQRASFRPYEIPYIGKSSINSKYQIPVEDILVSVKNDEIILRSRKLNKEILPRLGNAHNSGANSLPIYQFLSEIQTQNIRPSIGFNWNVILKKHLFLPRVEFDNIIISKARWRLNVKDFKILCAENTSLEAIKKWQKKKLIPDLVELLEGDNRLLINLNNKTSIKMLLDAVKKRKQFIIEEFLFTDDELVKDKQESSFCNQFVVSFYNEAKLKAARDEE